MKKTILAGLLLIALVTFLSIVLIPTASVPSSVTDSFVQRVQKTPSPSPITWTLMLTGDIIPGRKVNEGMVRRNDFMWPIRSIAPVLADADLTLIDLEVPLTMGCPIITTGFQFCGRGEFAQSLATAGVDVASVANNHTLNFGWEGLGETETLLSGVGIGTTGFSAKDPSCNNDVYCSKFLMKEVKGIRLGFLGYNAVGQQVDRERTKLEIEKANNEVDVLIVSVHWGKEYEREPVADASLAPDDPKEIGRLFVEWGADVVVGNHPHWYQGIEWYQGKPIFYALGNTIFDQEWSPETKVGYLAKLMFTETQTTKESMEIFPTSIRDFGEAYLLEGEEKETILRFLSQ